MPRVFFAFTHACDTRGLFQLRPAGHSPQDEVSHSSDYQNVEYFLEVDDFWKQCGDIFYFLCYPRCYRLVLPP